MHIHYCDYQKSAKTPEAPTSSRQTYIQIYNIRGITELYIMTKKDKDLIFFMKKKVSFSRNKHV